MIENQIERVGGNRGPRRWRYLIDIIVLVAVTFFLDALLSAFVHVPINLESGFVLDAIGKMLLVGIAWGLIRLRGETLADIGLKRPASWMRTFMIGVGLAAVVFIAIYLSEKAGFRRDLSKFKDVQRNLELAVLGVFYALIGAGFYEEFTFRGFLMQGLAMLFGGSRGAWIVACILQGALFGLAHAYQNPLGIVITGTLGVLMGLLVLASGRNLWLVIIGHGLFDRVVSFGSISKARRREVGKLASSGLRPQTSRQDCLRHVPPSWLSCSGPVRLVG
jgi:membrane protease YdiL (CAAX protease family)